MLAAGLMLAWACDLIVAADDTMFADVVGTRLGMCGVEYFGHPWEFGPRKAKELLLTGDAIDAEEAYRLGMVSKVFPVAEVGERTVEFARRIASVPTMASLLVKEAVNQTVDNMGLLQCLAGMFSLPPAQPRTLAGQPCTPRRSQWRSRPDGVVSWKDAPPLQTARKDAPMKFGSHIMGISLRHMPEIARTFELNGIDSVWVPEHLVFPGDHSGDLPLHRVRLP